MNKRQLPPIWIQESLRRPAIHDLTIDASKLQPPITQKLMGDIASWGWVKMSDLEECLHQIHGNNPGDPHPPLFHRDIMQDFGLLNGHAFQGSQPATPLFTWICCYEIQHMSKKLPYYQSTVEIYIPAGWASDIYTFAKQGVTKVISDSIHPGLEPSFFVVLQRVGDRKAAKRLVLRRGGDWIYG